MKTTTLARHEVSTEMMDLISRLVDLIPWPSRRRAIGGHQFYPRSRKAGAGVKITKKLSVHSLPVAEVAPQAWDFSVAIRRVYCAPALLAQVSCAV